MRLLCTGTLGLAVALFGIGLTGCGQEISPNEPAMAADQLAQALKLAADGRRATVKLMTPSGVPLIAEAKRLDPLDELRVTPLTEIDLERRPPLLDGARARVDWNESLAKDRAFLLRFLACRTNETARIRCQLEAVRVLSALIERHPDLARQVMLEAPEL